MRRHDRARDDHLVVLMCHLRAGVEVEADHISGLQLHVVPCRLLGSVDFDEEGLMAHLAPDLNGCVGLL